MTRLGYLQSVEGRVYSVDADAEFSEVIAKLLPGDVIEALKKKLDDQLTESMENAFEQLVYGSRERLGEVAARWAKDFLEAILSGDERTARELFACGPRSRYRFTINGDNSGEPWSRLIHGRLFETPGVELRRKLVEAHADLLRDERVADLESVIDGLSRQVAELETRNHRLGELAR